MFAFNELKDKRLGDQLIELAAFVKQAAVNGVAAHEVELTLFRGIMKMGRELLLTFIELQGTGDLGPELALPDGTDLARQAVSMSVHTRRSLANSPSNEMRTAEGPIKRLRGPWMLDFNFQRINSAICCSRGIR